VRSRYEVAVQCRAGQCALKRLAEGLEDTYYRAVLVSAAQRLRCFANEVYDLSLAEEDAHFRQVRLISVKDLQMYMDVCNLRLELLEETLREALIHDSSDSGLKTQTQEFVDIQKGVQCVFKELEPLVTSYQRQCEISSEQAFARGVSFPDVYALA
jgi:hypothetical protein